VLESESTQHQRTRSTRLVSSTVAAAVVVAVVRKEISSSLLLLFTAVQQLFVLFVCGDENASSFHYGKLSTFTHLLNVVCLNWGNRGASTNVTLVLYEFVFTAIVALFSVALGDSTNDR
jgi:hypothetical protein